MLEQPRRSWQQRGVQPCHAVVVCCGPRGRATGEGNSKRGLMPRAFKGGTWPRSSKRGLRPRAFLAGAGGLWRGFSVVRLIAPGVQFRCPHLRRWRRGRHGGHGSQPQQPRRHRLLRRLPERHGERPWRDFRELRALSRRSQKGLIQLCMEVPCGVAVELLTRPSLCASVPW